MVAKNSKGFPVSPFLNTVLTGLENGNAGFIATTIFGCLSLYLLWCTQKGNLKFGIRIPFFFLIAYNEVRDIFKIYFKKMKG